MSHSYSSLVAAKKDESRWGPMTHLLTNETISKLLDCSRKNQNYIHIDAYHCKPELISWRQINIIVFNTRFLSPTNQKWTDSSTYRQFFYYRPPGKFPIYRGRDRKIWYAKNSIYIDIIDTNQFDNRYGFSISIGNTNHYLMGCVCTTYEVNWPNSLLRGSK